MKVLFLLVLSCLFAVSFTQSFSDVPIPLIDTNAEGILGAPWQADGDYRHFYTGTDVTDYYTLPYRYGFRIQGYFPARTASEREVYSDVDRLVLKMCPFTPRFVDDDYEIAIETYEKDFCDGTTSVNQDPRVGLLSLVTFDGDEVSELITSEPASNGRRQRLTFNVEEYKERYPNGLYISLQLDDSTGNDVDWEIRIFRKGYDDLWDGHNCAIPSDATHIVSKCEVTMASLFGCTDGVWDPSIEECDTLIDEEHCTSSCLCVHPYIPDGEGGCTQCGNGFLEPEGEDGEACDTDLDENCAEDCMGCAEGFVFDDEGACVMCGNGVVDEGEECDYADDLNCDTTCTCNDGWASDDHGMCSLCGNGVRDDSEMCDPAITTACKSDCSSCRPPYVIPPSREFGAVPSGDCTLCGNFIIDEDEACDAADRNCELDCSGCIEYFEVNDDGICSRCGNGLLDGGEVCDSFRDGCAGDCTGCDDGMVPTGGKLGDCTVCGNGKLDLAEACDSGLDEDCADGCTHCMAPYTAVNKRCVLCGNGWLDVVVDEDGNVIEEESEVCDAAQPGCTSDCAQCEDGWTPAGDKVGSCIPACETCCDMMEVEEESSATSFTVSAILIASLFSWILA